MIDVEEVKDEIQEITQTHKEKFKDNPFYDDSYDLCSTMVKYILPRLEAYLEIAGDFVNLECTQCNEFDFRGEKITLKKAIEIVIEEFKIVRDDDFTKESDEILMLFAKIWRSLWW